MERRYRVRLDELLSDAVVAPAVLRGLLPRLQRFLEPFVASLLTPEQRTHAHHYVAGLLSDLDRKNAEGIAYLHDQEGQGLQKFLGQADWDHRPLLGELTRQVACCLSEPDGVLILDPRPSPRRAPPPSATCCRTRRASHQGVPGASQERGGVGGLPGADMGGLAPPPGVVVAGDVVADGGKAAGKKNIRRR